LSGISCVLKINTEQGDFFCKRVLPEIFNNEPKITKLLSSFFPEDFPEIIYSNNDNGLIITKDFGKDILSENKDFDNWLNAIKKFAQLQIKSIKHKDFLLKEGMFNRSLESMEEEILYYLNQDDKIFLNQDKGINSEEKQKLINSREKIKELYEKLSSYNIPETIEHGDLHSGNIAIKNNRIIFYDWSDCAISHPFMSLRPFFWNFFDKEGNLKEIIEDFPDIKNPYDKLLNTYLSEWLEFNTMDNLKEAFDLSQNLVWLSFSLQYILLVDSMEDHTKFQYKGHISKGFKKFIEYLYK
jgi:hypothetical protein